MRLLVAATLLLVLACATKPAPKAGAPSLFAAPALGWNAFTLKERAEGRALAGELSRFLVHAKTARAMIQSLTLICKAKFPNLDSKRGALQPGERFHVVFRGTSLAVVQIGKRPPSEGVRAYVLPIDAPHLALKARPTYSKFGLVLLDTRLRGPIDAPQWMSTPLALHAFVPRGDRAITFTIGESPDDPVLAIPDLLPHLAARVQAHRVVSSEQLDPIVAGPIPRERGNRAARLASALAPLLRARGLDERDFVDGEWALVPATQPAFVGVDRGLLAAYGQTHRSIAYIAFRTLYFEATLPEHTQILFFTDRGAHGFDSEGGRFFVNGVLARLGGSEPSAIARSQVLVASSGGGELGRGVVLNPRADDADLDLRRAVLDVFAKHRVPFQLAEGPGHSPAHDIATLGFPAMDLSLPVAGPGRPAEVTSLFDLMSAARAFRALFAR